MTRMLANLATAAAVAISAMMASASAHAQQLRYCDGSLVANSSYSIVLSNARTSEVEYHVQFQNLDLSRRRLTATLVPLSATRAFAVLRSVSHFDLGPYEQKDIAILTVQAQNPSGAGAPTPAQISQDIWLTCSFQ